ncbi:MAG TPA: PEGA domain-containing protein [Burkholderiales bacterium]
MESSGRTLVCSVLFLDIVEYSKKPVAEQLELKQAFNKVLASALEQVPARDRIILDTGDGAAVTFMGDPEDALFASIAVRDQAGSVPVRLGINLGPVRLVKDLNDQINIIGDGINVAQRVMSFARPGQLLVSRSFYEVVSCLSRDYARMFHHEGARTDKHVREHDVYSVVAGSGATRRIGDTLADAPAAPASLVWLEGSGPLGLRRSAIVAASLVFLTAVAGGVGARVMMREEPARPPAVAAGRLAPAAKPAAAPLPSAQSASTAPAPVARVEPAPAAEEPRRHARRAPPAGAGRLELAIAPWGEVLIDGKRRGVSPPLRFVDVPPGTHTIEIRNSTFPAHVQKVQLKAGEAVRIRHRFK